jgi:hypothetical protein
VKDGTGKLMEMIRNLAAVRIWPIGEFNDDYLADVWILSETRVEKSVAEMVE